MIQKHIEEDFSSIANWLAENELIINYKKGKNEELMFGTNQRIKKVDYSALHLYHNSILIAATQTYKYLDLLLTISPNKRNMPHNLAVTIKKVCWRIHLLRKIRSPMDAEPTKLIYQSMIVPILTYGSLLLFGSNSTPYQAANWKN